MLLTFPAGKFQGYRDREDVWCRCTVRRLGSRRTNGGHCVQLLFFRSKRRLFIILPSNVFHACLKHRPHDRLVPWCFWTGYINHSGIYDLCTTVVLAEGTYCRHSRFTHNAQKIAWTKNNLFFSSCWNLWNLQICNSIIHFVESGLIPMQDRNRFWRLKWSRTASRTASMYYSSPSWTFVYFDVVLNIAWNPLQRSVGMPSLFCTPRPQQRKPYSSGL